LEEMEKRKSEKRKGLARSKEEEREEDEEGHEEDDDEFGDLVGTAPVDVFSDGSISDDGNSDDDDDDDDGEEEMLGDGDDDDDADQEEGDATDKVYDSEEEKDSESDEDGMEDSDSNDFVGSDESRQEDEVDEETDGDAQRTKKDVEEPDPAEEDVDEVGVDTFEDIYGRLRDSKTKRIIKDNKGVAEPRGEKDSGVENSVDRHVVDAEKRNAADGGNRLVENASGIKLETNQSKYIPPSLRRSAALQSYAQTPDFERRTKVSRQVKGLLNRLSEANVASIAKGIEDIYASTPRNLVTSTLTELVMGACVPTNQATASRFLLEHALLIGVLHQSVGAEVGAHILQECAKMFDAFVKSSSGDEGVKVSDNVVGLLCSLFLFKVVHCSLLFDLVKSLTKRFSDKDVELILIIFRNIGFYLRKEEPKALKECLADLQRQAGKVKSQGESGSASQPVGFSKIQFMLDVLLAVKNNNMTKIPNYDAETPERMIKVLRSTLSAKNSSKGENSLRVSLEELVQADSKGKWWIVGSAWEGRQAAAGGSAASRNDFAAKASITSSASATVSDAKLAKIEALAAKQRMNTDLRKAIFAILLTAEDYVDCFQRLLKLNLNEKQGREIVYVLGSACLHEKAFNPYYGHLAAKLAAHDKRFKITLKYWFWDKYRELESLPERRAVNLADLLAHLVSRGELGLDILKIVEFYKMGERRNTSTFLKRMMRKILIGGGDDEAGDRGDDKRLLAPFVEISKSSKLSILRQSLLLFLRHFMIAEEEAGEEEESRTKLIKENIDKVAEFLKKK